MTPSTSGASDALRTFLKDDWDRWMAEYPELATSFGVRGFDDRWTDDSPSGIEKRTRHLHESRATLLRLSPEGLTPRERTNIDLYRELLEGAEAGLRFGLDPLPFRLGVPHNLLLPVNQMEGIHLTAADTLEIQPRENLQDYEHLLGRVRSLGDAIDQNIALLERGLEQGLTPHRVAIRGVPDQVRGLMPEDPMTSPLLDAFQSFPDSIRAADRQRLLEAVQRAYTTQLLPALRRLHEYLTTKYLPACREVPGVAALPDGSALYEYLVGWETTTRLRPREIHEIGLREVKRIRGAMELLMGKTGFHGTFPQFLDFLRTDRQFFFPDAASLVDRYRVIAKTIDPNLGRVFGRLPRLPYGVMPIPDYRAKSSPTAYYLPGAPATGRPGTFFANTYELTARPRWEMEALTLHEAVPGHHLQIAVAQELDDLPDFRRFTGPTAFVEGWGLYAESLGSELGMYDDPYSRMGQYIYDMWRSVRLVVDTGIHAMGWSRDDAIRFFRENTGKSEVDIAVEVDRYIVWPGQALAYKIGQLKIRELRTESEQALGPKFDRRAFHDRVLEEGALPLGMLEARIRAWVADGGNAPPTAA